MEYWVSGNTPLLQHSITPYLLSYQFNHAPLTWIVWPVI
jgi:hypothetical protein